MRKNQPYPQKIEAILIHQKYMNIPHGLKPKRTSSYLSPSLNSNRHRKSTPPDIQIKRRIGKLLQVLEHAFLHVSDMHKVEPDARFPRFAHGHTEEFGNGFGFAVNVGNVHTVGEIGAFVREAHETLGTCKKEKEK